MDKWFPWEFRGLAGAGGIKDVAELAPRADGPAVFASALLEAVGAA